MASELDRLRKEVEKKRKAASNKISRTLKQNGAKLEGTEYDPRRAAGVEKRYNRAQLQSYLGQLNDFMRRSNQFVGAKSGIPMRKGRFEYFDKLQQRQRQLGEAHKQSLEHLETPSGMSPQGNKQMLHQGQGNAVHGPYRDFDLRANELTGPRALERMISDMRARVSPDFLPKRLQQGRENLAKALTTIGQGQFISGFEYEENGVEKYQPGIINLTEFQFDAFWFGTNVAESIFMQYGIETERNASEVEGEEPTRKERWQDRVVNDAVNELGSVLQWASEQSPRSQTDAPAKSRKRRR